MRCNTARSNAIVAVEFTVRNFVLLNSILHSATWLFLTSEARAVFTAVLLTQSLAVFLALNRILIDV